MTQLNMPIIFLLLVICARGPRANAHTQSRLLLEVTCGATQCRNPLGECEDQVSCFANPCTATKNGGCGNRQCTPNYCGGCHPVCEGDVGDPCGSAPDDCAALRCACGLCDDDETYYGCSCPGGCTLEYNPNGLLTCSGMILRDRVCCGGFKHCVSYHDGCNTCSCQENGLTACTEMACMPPYPPSKCLQCEHPYTVNDGGHCQFKVTCSINPDCGGNPFHCRADPICNGGNAATDPYCTTPPEVCVAIEGGRCTDDDDCSDGYSCDGYRNNGNFKQCIKYQ
eukprot:1079426_1